MGRVKTEPVPAAEPLFVQIFEAKPNKMFTEEQTAAVRFLRYTQPVACAECGKRSKHRWTVLYSFKALSMAMIVPKESDKSHPPLTPVCRDHLLKPAAMKGAPANGLRSPV